MTPAELARLITPTRVMALHREAAERYGGDPTQRIGDSDCVDGRIGSAANAAAYNCPEDGDDMGLICAVYLLYYLAKDHCFVDGNKRIAWLSCVEFFKNLQLTVDASEDEAYELMINISSTGSTLTPADVAIWLAERLIAIEGEGVN